jgi:hypothetical protein
MASWSVEEDLEGRHFIGASDDERLMQGGVLASAGGITKAGATRKGRRLIENRAEEARGYSNHSKMNRNAKLLIR